jgi:hypothetical protein
MGAGGALLRGDSRIYEQSGPVVGVEPMKKR